MIDFDNQTSYEIYSNWFEEIEESLAKDKMLELLIVDNATMKELNLKHRKIDKTTDVLSFPIKESKTNFIGSIIISADTANSVANEMGHTLEEELKILFVHGLLHTLGFDHETDNGQMRQKEAEIAQSMGLSKTLLGR
jgi:probable rRNA maturation factor